MPRLLRPFAALSLGGLVLCLALPAAVAQDPAATAAAPAVDPAPFAQSLSLRTDRTVADSTRPTFAWLAQTSPVAYASKGALRLKVSLTAWQGDTRPVKELGTFAVFGGNLAASPYPFSVDTRGAADGFYRLRVEVTEGDATIATLTRPLVLVDGMDSKHADFVARLAKISGKDSAKASVLYPFDHARTINLGKRVYDSNDRNPEFGISQAGAQQLYDFSAGLKKSAELLAALERGQDPLWRAGGDRERHYHLAEADEILPYRVFVPSTWDGKAALPLVFVLHGNTRDHNFYHDRDGGIIPKTAEKHGFMLVAPLGYAPNAGYNYVPFDRERGTRGMAGAVAAPQQFGPAPAAGAGGGRGGFGGGPGGVNGSTVPALVRAEWSELDAMRVFDLIKREYPIDPNRIYLFGYSAGGQGGHYIAQKYPEHWAAVGIGGSNTTAGRFYDFERVKKIPMMLFSGTEDAGPLRATRTLVEAMQAKGVPAVLKELPGATHDTAPSVATPVVFEFFAKHVRK
jgi:poly(3-hydroxybutyrate) depolymerase